jgi:hypothetical protein
MSKKKTSKKEEEVVETKATEEDINVNDIVDDVESTVEDYENIDSDIDKAEEKPEEKPDQDNVTMVSDLQPSRPKPGYPQNLEHHRGFGYKP